MNVLVILNDPPYGTERCYNGPRLAYAARRAGGRRGANLPDGRRGGLRQGRVARARRPPQFRPPGRSARSARCRGGALRHVHGGSRARGGRPRVLKRDALAGVFQQGQCGAVVALAGRPVCIDAVSQADVFAELWPRLLVGYAAEPPMSSPGDRPDDAIDPSPGLGRLCSARRRASGGDRHGPVQQSRPPADAGARPREGTCAADGPHRLRCAWLGPPGQASIGSRTATNRRPRRSITRGAPSGPRTSCWPRYK